MPFSYRDETKELNELTRKEASGSFVQLSDGFTHYELSNPGGEETVVLVHGFSVPYFIYDPTFDFLTQLGFRVLRYDLFGRGFSDRPHTRYNIDLFVRQLSDLLDALQLTRPVHLVGLSTGGPIIATYAARFPERVDKLILIDPVGAKPLPFAPLLRVVTMPFVGEAVASWVRSDRLNTSLASLFFDRELVEHLQARYVPQMRYIGFRHALLSTVRNHMLDSFLDSYKQVHALGKPVLLFWGRNDTTVPFKHSDILRAAMPSLRFHAIEGCGHTPHYEKPEVVNQILLRFLRQ